MAHDVFISYSKEDEPTAEVVRRQLEDHGIGCWYAPRDATPGVDYEESILDAICASRLIVLVLSSHSNVSPHVKREIQIACTEEPQIPIIPFRTEDFQLNNTLRYYLGSVQRIDATQPLGNHVQLLSDHVKARLAQGSQAVEKPPRTNAILAAGETGEEKSSSKKAWAGKEVRSELEVRERQAADVAILDLTGTITIGLGTVTLRAALHLLSEQGKKKILLNLSGVSVIDSSGIGELVASYTLVHRQGGEIKLLNLTDKIQDLLVITKLLTVFDVYEIEREALSSF